MSGAGSRLGKTSIGQWASDQWKQLRGISVRLVTYHDFMNLSFRRSRVANVTQAAQRVVDTERCTGCGACALMDKGLTMSLSDDGYMRPVPNGDANSTTVESFQKYCPGISVESPFANRRSHPILGPYVEMWHASATDDLTRQRGSSGGVLTVLQQWAVSRGATATNVAPSPTDARRTVPVRIMTKEEVLASAGSRYAPVAAASGAGGLSRYDVAVGKPCEAAALRQIYSDRSEAPLVLSFFCMGTPSSHATDELVRTISGVDEEVDSLTYRGNGWPGEFTVTRQDGSSESMSYGESWGVHLGPTVQWRCRTCLDGLGESADLVAGDLWDVDENGYPSFEEQDGVSVLIARTPRGRDAALAAQRAGLLRLNPTSEEAVLRAQPSQVQRKARGLARLAATWGMGLPTTRFRNFAPLRRTSWNPTLLKQEFFGTAGRLKVRGYDWARVPLRLTRSIVRKLT